MSLSIGSLGQSVDLQPSSAVGGAVLEKSLDVERQAGQEAVDLIQTASHVGDSSGGLLSVYA
jgi:hypothetical protein